MPRPRCISYYRSHRILPCSLGLAMNETPYLASRCSTLSSDSGSTSLMSSSCRMSAVRTTLLMELSYRLSLLLSCSGRCTPLKSYPLSLQYLYQHYHRLPFLRQCQCWPPHCHLPLSLPRPFLRYSYPDCHPHLPY